MGTQAGPLTSIQERLFPDATCFGCGPANPDGLHLRSHVMGDVVVAEFLPWPRHDNGLGFLNGGIIATLLDCHTGAAALNEAAERDWAAAEGADFSFVTAGLDIRYLRPAPLTEPVELTAVIRSCDENAIVVEGQLLFDGKIRAEATSLWKRWRPRADRPSQGR